MNTFWWVFGSASVTTIIICAILFFLVMGGKWPGPQ